MKLYDIYKHKKDDSIIQIDSFATKMNTHKEHIIVYTNIERHNELEIGSCPSFNGYGTKEEIEKEYELLVSADDLNKYEDWKEIYALIETKKKD